jgi:hypothetical protein
MKKLIKIYSLPIALTLCISSCGGNRMAVADTDTVAVTTDEEEAPRNSTRDYFDDHGPVVPIVYNSPLAKAAPAYEEGKELKEPLVIYTPRKIETDRIDITPGKEFGAWFYTTVFKNTTDETVRVKAVHCPDSIFDLYWRVGMEMSPGVFGAVWMRVAEPVDVDDYPIVVTYDNEAYPPQTFYLNFYSKGIPEVADN